MLKILVTYAVQGEFVEIKWPDVEPYYIRTGIGKVKSAFHLAEAIRQVQPDLVLNIGSAGTVNHQVGNRMRNRFCSFARSERLLQALDGEWNL